MAKWAQDKVTVDNPYWDKVKDLLPKDLWDYDGKLFGIRLDLCRRYSWAIPDPDALAFVAEQLGPKAVEMGAGTGLWAYLLGQMGVQVEAFDLQPPNIDYENIYHSPRKAEHPGFLGQPREVFYPVQRGLPAFLANYPETPLFLCWPPYDDPMGMACLMAYAGKRVVYIGEGEGGCCGEETFWEMLKRDWHRVASHRITQWPGIHDRIVVYERGPESEQQERRPSRRLESEG